MQKILGTNTDDWRSLFKAIVVKARKPKWYGCGLYYCPASYSTAMHYTEPDAWYCMMQGSAVGCMMHRTALP